MAREYKKIEEEVARRVIKKEVISSVTCDICGEMEQITDSYWNYGWHSSAETSVKCVREYSGSVFTCSFDICPICFTGQFAEMMKKEFGAEMECD